MIRHKDVKSDNILMHGGKVFLADFGSSWDGFAQGSLNTHSDDPKGHTSRYAAPEVITNDPRSAKSDIFSLGGVFYEIFCALEVSWVACNTEYYVCSLT
jgi:serine/threonine protein kinase